jgi:pectate lyase-like protein/parallel beta helix pectate lyase-like protein
MATTTSNFGLRKPASSDTVNVAADIAANMDLIDAHAHYGTFVRWTDVTAHGAIGDGATNDSAAISAAIVAAGTNGVVYFPPGKNFRIATPGLSAANLTGITFMGYGATISGTASGQYALMTLQECVGLTFLGLTFDGGSVVGYEPLVYGNKCLILSRGTERTTFRDCTFQHHNDTTILDSTEATTGTDPAAVKAGRTVITGCRFEDCAELYNNKYGGNRGVVFIGNHIHACYGPVKIDSEPDSATYAPGGAAVISNNVWVDCTGDSGTETAAVHIEENSFDVIVTGNVFENFTDFEALKTDAGQTVKDYGRITVSNNRFHNFVGKIPIVMRANGAAKAFSDVAIKGNAFNGTSGACILMIQAATAAAIKNVVIANNEFVDWNTVSPAATPGHAVSLDLAGDFSGLRIENNGFDRRNTQLTASQYDIYILADVAKTQGRVIVAGNHFLCPSVSTDAVSINGLNALVLHGNTFEKSTVLLRNTTARMTANRFSAGVLSLISAAAACVVYAQANLWSRDGGSQNYGVRVDGAGIFYEYGNMYTGLDTSVFLVSGTRYGTAMDDAAIDTVMVDGSYAAATTDVLKTRVTTDANARLTVNADGKLEWGDGTLAADANLYRLAADSIKTDDKLTVAGVLEALSSLRVSWNQTTALQLNFDTISAAGSNTNQDIKLDSKAASLVKVNMTNNSGINGFQVGNGAATAAEVFRVTGAGKVTAASTITPLVSTTAARPSAATAGAGAMYYDTTLSKPGWSDGTAWRDAAGTAI